MSIRIMLADDDAIPAHGSSKSLRQEEGAKDVFRITGLKLK